MAGETSGNALSSHICKELSDHIGRGHATSAIARESEDVDSVVFKYAPKKSLTLSQLNPPVPPPAWLPSCPPC